MKRISAVLVLVLSVPVFAQTGALYDGGSVITSTDGGREITARLRSGNDWSIALRCEGAQSTRYALCAASSCAATASSPLLDYDVTTPIPVNVLPLSAAENHYLALRTDDAGVPRCLGHVNPWGLRPVPPAANVNATTAAMTLYVDPTGSDSNACTASGTQACLTIGGALLKVPGIIRHLVTVNVAAGTYSEVMRVQGFNIEGLPGSASTAALTIAGTQANFTPTTGSATGTLTAYSVGGTAGAHPIATNSGATWTVNDLRGRYLQITGGTGSGQYVPITSNTATTISLAGTLATAPVAGSTYAIVTPGPIFTGANATVEGVTGSGLVTLQDLSFQPSTGAAIVMASTTTGKLTLTRVRAIGSTAFSATTSIISPILTVNQGVFQGTTNGLLLPQFSVFTAANIFVNCAATCAGAGIQGSSRGGYITALTGTIAGNWQTALFRIQHATGPMTSTGLWFDCGSSSNIAASIVAPSDSHASFVGAGFAANVGPYFSGCGAGYSLNAVSLSYIDNGVVFTNVTSAIVLTHGARVLIESGISTTGVTNFLTVDGTVYTDADLTASTRVTGVQGSYASRP